MPVSCDSAREETAAGRAAITIESTVRTCSRTRRTLLRISVRRGPASG